MPFTYNSATSIEFSVYAIRIRYNIKLISLLTPEKMFQSIVFMRLFQRNEQSNHWADMSESGSSWGIWILFQIHRWFGRLPFRLALYPVMVYFFLVKKQARHASLEYLRHIQKFQPHFKANNWGSFKHFISFGETLLDKILAHAGRYTLKNVHVLGREAVQTYIDKKSGFVILTAHIGNLEVSRSIAQLRNIPLNILVHTQHAERFNRILKTINPSSQVNLIQVTQLDSALAIILANKVQAGEAVVIAGDRIPVGQDVAKRVVSAQFLGQAAPFPTGPYILAHLLQVPVFFVTCTQQHKNYLLQYQAFAERIDLPRANRDAALQAYAQQFADLLTEQCQKTPLQWFNFYPFWQTPQS